MNAKANVLLIPLLFWLAAAPAFGQPAEDISDPDAFAESADVSGIDLREAPEPVLTGKDALKPSPGGLTADQVAERTLKSSPTLASRQAEIDAADAKVNEAIANFLPRLKLTAMYRRVSSYDASLGGAIVGAANAGPVLVGPCPDPAMGDQCALDATGQPIGAAEFEFPVLLNHYSLNASLALPLSDYVLRLMHILTATRSNKAAMEIQKRAEELKVASDARIAYYNWLRAVAGVAVAKSSLARFQAMQKDAEAAFKLGTVTKADVLRLEALVASTELAIVETETFRRLAEEQLATLMDEPAKKYEVGEDVLSRPDPQPDPVDVDDLVKEAYSRRLEPKLMGELSRSLRAGAKAARVGEWPRLDAFGDLTYANPNLAIFPQEEKWQATWAAGVALSWTLNDTFSGLAGTAALEANRRKLEADLENLKRGIKLEVTSAYLDLEKARKALDTSTRGCAAADEAYRVARDLYKVGRSTTTDLITAESELVSASLREVNAILDLNIASQKLTHATGRDVP